MGYWNAVLEKWKSFLSRRRKKGKGSLFYIGGSDTLTPPLSAEEERQAVEAFMAGSKEARDLLIEHNLRLVVYIARKFEIAGVNVEDLISIGTIGLMKAVDTFDSTRKARFSTYASRCIENAILTPANRRAPHAPPCRPTPPCVPPCGWQHASGSRSYRRCCRGTRSAVDASGQIPSLPERLRP